MSALKSSGSNALKWRSVTASAPAKVILHGEHSVVYGKLALASSIDLRTKVSIKLTSPLKKRQILRLYLLNCSKKCLDFDLETLRMCPYNMKNTNIDEVLKEKLAQIVCDNCLDEHSEHSDGIVALLYLFVAFLKESDIELMPAEINGV